MKYTFLGCSNYKERGVLEILEDRRVEEKLSVSALILSKAYLGTKRAQDSTDSSKCERASLAARPFCHMEKAKTVPVLITCTRQLHFIPQLRQL